MHVNISLSLGEFGSSFGFSQELKRVKGVGGIQTKMKE